FAAGALYVYDAGFATVQVEDEHRSFTLPVPLAVAEVGVHYLAAAHQNRLPKPIAHLREALPRLLAALEETADATLLKIVRNRESVLLQKAGGLLILKVECPTEKVQIKAPVKRLTKILRRALAVHNPGEAGHRVPGKPPMALSNPLW